MLSNSINSIRKSINLADFGLAWIIFFSLVYQKMAPIGFMLMFVSVIIKRKKITLNEFKTYFSKGPAVWFILYYVMLIVGMLWTDNIAFGLQKLENKLTFIIFPFLYLLSNHKWEKIEWKELFVWSLFFVLVIYELMAFWRYFSFPEQPIGYQFMESRFTLFMHRSYFACYLVIGLVFLMNDLKMKFSITRSILALLFVIGVLQTGSKAGILTLIPILLTYIILSIKFESKKIAWLLGFSVSIIISIILFTNNPIINRFNNTLTALTEIKLKDNHSVESNTARIIMWNTSWEEWKENFFLGSGTGDYDDVLTARNFKKNNIGVTEERLNSHNQFLNTGVQLGIFGFLILLMIFISAMYHKISNLNQILILSVFLINFLVESFIETQSGIVLFCIILLVFFESKKNHSTADKTIIL